MLQGTSRPGSSHMRLGSGEPQCHERIVSLSLDSSPDWSLSKNAKPAESVFGYRYILPPNIIMI